MSKAMRLRDDYRTILGKIKDLQQEADEILDKMRQECTHPACAEIEYTPTGTLFRAQAPERLCLVCGELEAGWNGGYNKLNKSVVVANYSSYQKEEFYSLQSLDYDLRITYALPTDK